MAATEKRESTQKSFHERGSFKAAVAVIGLLGGIWALLGAPKPWEVATELAANPLPLRNTEIVLDASARMGDPFGKATKLDIAAEAVDRYAAASEQIGLALRRVGGDCDQPSEPVVGFDDRHGDDVASAAGELQPGGRSNLGLAVLSAINDFSGEAFHRPGAENQIVIFAGGGDQCGDRTGRQIRNQLEQANIHPEFHVFAIKVSKKEMRNLKAMKRQLEPVVPVELDEANSVKQLYEAVEEDAPESEGGQTEAAAPSGGEEQTRAAEQPGTSQAAASEAESWSAPAPAAVEIPPAEDVEEEPPELSEEEEEAEREEKEKEEKEEVEEEELELEPAKEAPKEEEPEGGEEAGSLGGSEPVQTPPKSLPRPG